MTPKLQDRSQQFYLNAIKMDLYRIVTATGDIRKPIPFQSVQEFLDHCLNDFNKITLSPLQLHLLNQLKDLSSQLTHLEDPHTRLRWTEHILTIRCRL